MSDFNSVFSAAQQLPEQDRLKLIDALWDTVPSDVEAPFSEAWLKEIEQRSAELDAGTTTTIPWTQVRQEALERIHHGKGN